MNKILYLKQRYILDAELSRMWMLVLYNWNSKEKAKTG